MAEKQFKERVRHLFKQTFSDDTVDVSDGYHDNVHVVIVSRRFDGMSERERLDMLWELARRQLNGDAGRISLLLAYSPDELK